MAKSKTSKVASAKASSDASAAKGAKSDDASKAAKEPKVASSDAHIDEAWVEKQTQGLKGEAPATGVPLAVFLAEAQDCAGFLTQYWEPELDERGKVLRPGLKSAVLKGAPERFGLHLASEIIALRRRADDAQTEYLLASKLPKSTKAQVDRAHELLDQWTGAIEWLLDDGVEDDRDAQFAAVVAANAELDTVDGTARALKDFGGLAKSMASDLEGLLDFDAATIAEGLALSEKLLASNVALDDNAPARKALARRNDLLTALFERVSRVRKAARLRFVGEHAAIAQKVTSAHQRRARAYARRKEAAKEPAK